MFALEEVFLRCPQKKERIKEKDLVLPALRFLNNCPFGFAKTKERIDHSEFIFNPAGKDAMKNPNRNDIYFSQKVRNLVSHRKSSNNLIANDHAKYDSEKHGLWITDAGRTLLKTLGG